MNYKDTLNLPQTKFSMKANLANKEPKMVEQWDAMNLTETLMRPDADKPSFIMHDGPPYANGHLHMGHALNKILKDMVVRYQLMNGHSVPFVPGWDCHGLPIEHQVIQKLKKKKEQKTVLEVRQLCRDYAQEFVGIQKEEFKRLGVLGRWDDPYLTMNYSYEAGIVDVFGRLAERGYIERGLKPIYWCGTCETALAEAEIEYADHSSPSVFVKFETVWNSKQASLLIWTTTPWTLPSNLAIAVHPDLTYVVVDCGNEILILAEGLCETTLKDKAGLESYHILETVQGKDLVGLTYQHPFMGQVEGMTAERSVIEADFVTAEDGTGCVHIAPGHGEDDFRVGCAHGLPAFAPVNARAVFTDAVPLFEGQHVFKANPLVIELLKDKGALLHQQDISHSYPHCWRCRRPVIFRATEQWFINVDTNDLRQNVLKTIEEDVSWLPDWGQTRITEMVKNRPNWCISRQRSWGVPIPVAYCKSCSHSIVDQGLIKALADKVREKGCDVWYAESIEDIYPELRCPKCDHDHFDKETDILDVWFDSGASHYAVLEQDKDLSFPADLYLEGSDQHRGWFQSSIFLSMAGMDEAPFKKVLTHGFIVDGNGRKMSKSLGNVIAPQKIIDQFGADIIRLFVASADYSDDIRMSDEVIKQKVDAYRKIRNTCRYILGNTADFNVATDRVDYDQLTGVDQWALGRLQKLIERCTEHYNAYLFYKVFAEIYQFCTIDMSARYMDILKDRLYTAGAKSNERLSSQTVLTDILHVLVRLMAPILAFSSEELWQELPEDLREGKASVHLASWPESRPEWADESLAQRWECLLSVREEVLKAIEPLRSSKEIGSSLEVGILVKAPSDVYAVLQAQNQDLAMVFIVSDVNIEEADQLEIVVQTLDDPKCVRCWTLSPTVGSHQDHVELCERCVEVVRGMELDE